MQPSSVFLYRKQTLIIQGNIENVTFTSALVVALQSMMSPRREGANKSQSNTPYRRADSEPLKHRLTFTPSSSSLSTTSQCAPPPTTAPAPQPPPPILESPPTPPQQQELPGWLGKRSLGVNTDVTGDIPPTDNEGGELNIEGALTDELKILQVNGTRSQDSANVHVHVYTFTCTFVHRMRTATYSSSWR